MMTIAEEETEHAELSWDLAAWLEPTLTPAERDIVRSARAQALREVVESVATPVDPSLAHVAGLPPAPIAVAMAVALERQVLST